MYTCYIIDDEEHCIKALEGYIHKMPELVLLKSFTNPLLALEEIRLGVQPDIVFLDVNMPELSGLSIADLLPKHISIVFSTGHPKYALNAFEKDAVDFLLKPYSFDTFVKTVTKIRNRRDLNAPAQLTKSPIKSIFINPGIKGAVVQVVLSEILYIEAKDHLIEIHLQTETLTSKVGLQEFHDQLANDSFIRIHRSFVVNIDQIKSIENNNINFKTGKKAPLSATYRHELLQKIKHQTIKNS